MKRKVIAFNTEVRTFSLKEQERYKAEKAKLEDKGTITEIFVNNGYGFMFRKDRVIM